MAALQNATDRGIYLGALHMQNLQERLPDVVKNMPFVRYAITDSMERDL